MRPPLRSREVVNNSNGYDGVKTVISIWKTNVVADHDLMFAISSNVHQLDAAVAAHFVDVFVNAKILAIATT